MPITTFSNLSHLDRLRQWSTGTIGFVLDGASSFADTLTKGYADAMASDVMTDIQRQVNPEQKQTPEEFAASAAVKAGTIPARIATGVTSDFLGRSIQAVGRGVEYVEEQVQEHPAFKQSRLGTSLVSMGDRLVLAGEVVERHLEDIEEMVYPEAVRERRRADREGDIFSPERWHRDFPRLLGQMLPQVAIGVGASAAASAATKAPIVGQIAQVVGLKKYKEKFRLALETVLTAGGITLYDSGLEASDTYDRVLKQGGSREKAADAAGYAFWENMKLVVLQIPEALVLRQLRTVLSGRKGADLYRGLQRAGAATTLGGAGAVVGTGAATEAVQELAQESIGEEAEGAQSLGTFGHLGRALELAHTPQGQYLALQIIAASLLFGSVGVAPIAGRAISGRGGRDWTDQLGNRITPPLDLESNKEQRAFTEEAMYHALRDKNPDMPEILLWSGHLRGNVMEASVLGKPTVQEPITKTDIQIPTADEIQNTVSRLLRIDEAYTSGVAVYASQLRKQAEAEERRRERQGQADIARKERNQRLAMEYGGKVGAGYIFIPKGKESTAKSFDLSEFNLKKVDEVIRMGGTDRTLQAALEEGYEGVFDSKGRVKVGGKAPFSDRQLDELEALARSDLVRTAEREIPYLRNISERGGVGFGQVLHSYYEHARMGGGIDETSINIADYTRDRGDHLRHEALHAFILNALSNKEIASLNREVERLVGDNARLKELGIPQERMQEMQDFIRDYPADRTQHEAATELLSVLIDTSQAFTVPGYEKLIATLRNLNLPGIQQALFRLYRTQTRSAKASMQSLTDATEYRLSQEYMENGAETAASKVLAKLSQPQKARTIEKMREELNEALPLTETSPPSVAFTHLLVDTWEIRTEAARMLRSRMAEQADRSTGKGAFHTGARRVSPYMLLKDLNAHAMRGAVRYTSRSQGVLTVIERPGDGFTVMEVAGDLGKFSTKVGEVSSRAPTPAEAKLFSAYNLVSLPFSNDSPLLDRLEWLERMPLYTVEGSAGAKADLTAIQQTRDNPTPSDAASGYTPSVFAHREPPSKDAPAPTREVSGEEDGAIKRASRATVNFLKQGIRPVVDQLYDIHPPTALRLQQYALTEARETIAITNAARDFFRAVKKNFNKEEQRRVKLALLNGDDTAIYRMVRDYPNIGALYNQMRTEMNRVYAEITGMVLTEKGTFRKPNKAERAEGKRLTGINVGFVETFFPRQLKDPKDTYRDIVLRSQQKNLRKIAESIGMTDALPQNSDAKGTVDMVDQIEAEAEVFRAGILKKAKPLVAGASRLAEALEKQTAVLADLVQRKRVGEDVPFETMEEALGKLSGISQEVAVSMKLTAEVLAPMRDIQDRLNLLPLIRAFVMVENHANLRKIGNTIEKWDTYHRMDDGQKMETIMKIAEGGFEPSNEPGNFPFTPAVGKRRTIKVVSTALLDQYTGIDTSYTNYARRAGKLLAYVKHFRDDIKPATDGAIDIQLTVRNISSHLEEDVREEQDIVKQLRQRERILKEREQVENLLLSVLDRPRDKGITSTLRGVQYFSTISLVQAPVQLLDTITGAFRTGFWHTPKQVVKRTAQATWETALPTINRAARLEIQKIRDEVFEESLGEMPKGSGGSAVMRAFGWWSRKWFIPSWLHWGDFASKNIMLNATHDKLHRLARAGRRDAIKRRPEFNRLVEADPQLAEEVIDELAKPRLSAKDLSADMLAEAERRADQKINDYTPPGISEEARSHLYEMLVAREFENLRHTGNTHPRVLTALLTMLQYGTPVNELDTPPVYNKHPWTRAMFFTLKTFAIHQANIVHNSVSLEIMRAGKLFSEGKYTDSGVVFGRAAATLGWYLAIVAGVEATHDEINAFKRWFLSGGSYRDEFFADKFAHNWLAYMAITDRWHEVDWGWDTIGTVLEPLTGGILNPYTLEKITTQPTRELVAEMVSPPLEDLVNYGWKSLSEWEFDWRVVPVIGRPFYYGSEREVPRSREIERGKFSATPDQKRGGLWERSANEGLWNNRSSGGLWDR